MVIHSLLNWRSGYGSDQQVITETPAGQTFSAIQASVLQHSLHALPQGFKQG